MKITKTLLYISTLLIPFYFFWFHFGVLSTNIFEIFIFLSLIAFIIEQPRAIIDKKYFLGAAILFVVLILGILFSPDKTHAIGLAKSWFVVPAIYGGLVYKKFDSKTISKLAIPLFIIVILLAVWAIMQKLGFLHKLFYQVGDGSFDQYIDQGRVYGPFESPNFLAMFLVPAGILSLQILNLVKSKIWKAVSAISYILPLLAIYFSGSRAGAIAVIISVAVLLNYLFINKRPATENHPFQWALFGTCWVALNALYLSCATIWVRTAAGGDAVRIEIYKYSLKMITTLKDFLFGIGLGNFQNKLSEMPLSDWFRENGLSYALHPHNLLLAIWLNLGILGLVCFIILVVLFFKYCYESGSKIRAYLIAAMLAILVHGFFDTTYFKNDLAAIFWLLIGIGLILNREKSYEKSL